MNFNHSGRIGFVYEFELVDAMGNTLSRDRCENIIPDEGRDYILNAALNGGAQFSTWFIGLYSGNYAPQVTDTAATFPTSATEITTAYAESARQTLVDGALDDGLFANIASPAVFTFNTETIVRGGFIVSSSIKGGLTGVLLSAVLAGSPKTAGAGESLRVKAGLSLVTV